MPDPPARLVRLSYQTAISCGPRRVVNTIGYSHGPFPPSAWNGLRTTRGIVPAQWGAVSATSCHPCIKRAPCDLAGVFPVRPFNQALLNPFALDRGFAGHQLLVLAIWGVAGGFVAIRRFRWDPRPE